MSSPFNEEKYKRLLEGLEISEVMYGDLDSYKRIDAELYNKNYTHFKTALKRIPFTTFENECDTIKKGIFDIKSSCYSTSGIPFVRISNLRNMTIDTSDIVYIPFEQHRKNYKTELKRGDIVLSKTAIAAASIVNLEKCNVSQDTVAIKLKPESKVLSSYVVVFLNTKYGLEQLQRRFTGNIQMHLNLEECKKEVLIPIFPKQFQEQIQVLLEKSILCSSQSLSLYSEAEDFLISELGLTDWQPDNNPVNIKQLKESFLASGRLDAEYYQPKYEDYASFIRKYKGGVDTLGKVCTLNEKNFNPIENHEYKYIELSNIGNSGEITGCTTSIGVELPSRARRLVHTNDVIVSSIEGSLQSVALVTDDYDKAICSTGFYVVKSETINPETLLVLFKSEPMQNLLKQGCSGTILTAIGRNELQNIVMPKIRNEVQTEIATYVQKSISLRNEAKQLLESAKLRVEDAISTPPYLIDNQLVAEHNKMTEESTYYYRLAEWTLLRELYAEAWVTTSTANYSIKNYSVCKSSGRLDAEYYQPKYDALFAQLSKYECDTIKDIAHIKKSVEPGSEAYQDSGIPFLRVSDVSKFGISEPNIFLSTSDFNLNELRPKKDTILLSKDGSVGIAYKVEEDLDCITSGALLHLSVFNEDYTPDYLTLVLNSIVVQMQAERDSNGAIIQHWKPSEIEQVIIPKLPKPIQETISAKIQKSFALKAESKRLLDEAKMMVEREIEKGGVI